MSTGRLATVISEVSQGRARTWLRDLGGYDHLCSAPLPPGTPIWTIGKRTDANRTRQIIEPLRRLRSSTSTGLLLSRAPIASGNIEQVRRWEESRGTEILANLMPNGLAVMLRAYKAALRSGRTRRGLLPSDLRTVTPR